MGYRSFALAVPTIWNDLSAPLRFSPFISNFYSALKTHLLPPWVSFPTQFALVTGSVGFSFLVWAWTRRGRSRPDAPFVGERPPNG